MYYAGHSLFQNPRNSTPLLEGSMSSNEQKLKAGTPVFNIYSLRVGNVLDVVLTPPRLGRYAPDLVIVELIEDGHRPRRARWRLDNCRKFTPRALRSRQAFLLLAKVLKVPARRLRPRVPLARHGFNKWHQQRFMSRLRREQQIKVSSRALRATQTSNQVIAAVLAAPLLPPPRRHRRK